MTGRLDEVDKRIIYRLMVDARHTSAPMIADELDVSAATIRNRTRRLEQRGAIRGYRANIDHEQAIGGLANHLVCSTPVPDRERRAEQVRAIPGVISVRELMTGRRNLSVKAIGTDTDDLTRIARSVSNLDIEIESEDLIHREHYQPYSPFGPEQGQSNVSITDYMSLAGKAEVVELTVAEDAPAANKTLQEVSDADLIGEDVLLVTIERDEEVLTPRGDSLMQPGDLATLFSRDGVPREVIDALTNDRNEPTELSIK
jgi:DNA-binding Lrp family transcriptional regulator